MSQKKTLALSEIMKKETAMGIVTQSIANKMT